MKLSEINNFPTIFVPTGTNDETRTDKRVLVQKLIARKALSKSRWDPEHPENKTKSRFIDWLGQQTWTRKGQDEQPKNSHPDLGSKVVWR